MKKKLNRFLALITIASIFISTTGCNKNTKTINDYKKSGKIIMGTNAQFPPFEYYENEEIIGIDKEIAQKIAEKLDIELVVEDINFSALLDSLNKEKVDFVLAGMTITDDRKTIVDFSNPYYTTGQCIITMNTNTSVNSITDLVNKKIGIQEDTTGEKEASKIEGAIISKYNTVLGAIMDMKSGNLDAIIFDLEPAKKFAEQNPDIKVIDELLTQEDYGVSVRKGETELLSLINEVLKDMKDDGEYDKMIKRY